MQAERERAQSWRIHVSAKANNFNFRLRFTASSYIPTWTLSSCRISILLKLRKFVLRISSHPTQPKDGGGFITTKLMKIVNKFRIRTRPNVAAKRESNLPYPKDPIRIAFWVMGAFLVQSIRKKDQKGIIVMLASVGFFVASLLLFKKFKSAKVVSLLAALLLVVAATIVCYLFFYFDYNYWDYMGRSAWNNIGDIW